MKQADAIRAFVLANYVEPARRRHVPNVTVRAGNVHREMGLKNAMPAVCSALGSNKFAELAGVAPSHRSGPSNGSNAIFGFDLQKEVPRSTNHAPIIRTTTKGSPPAASPDLTGALVLISCVKSKRTNPTQARDLYVSPLFTMARDFAEARGADFRILSAMYGLIEPQAQLAPYDRTLNGLGVAARRSWAEKVLADLLPLAIEKGRIVFFAGQRYREFLIKPLLMSGVHVEVPMEGLRQGEQLSWLRARL